MKIRMAIMDWPWFEKGDAASFHVLLKKGGSIEIPIEYFECEDPGEARKKAHAIVDRLFDHKEHMAMIERVAAESKEKHEQLAKDCRSINELTVSPEPPKKDAPEPKAKKVSQDLLDLGDL